jgi:hypothetical protein
MAGELGSNRKQKSLSSFLQKRRPSLNPRFGQLLKDTDLQAASVHSETCHQAAFPFEVSLPPLLRILDRSGRRELDGQYPFQLRYTLR